MIFFKVGEGGGGAHKLEITGEEGSKARPPKSATEFNC